MQNEEGKYVDLYVPKKCCASNRPIPAFDYGAIQFSIAACSGDGKYKKGEKVNLVMSGRIRSKGNGDDWLSNYLIETGVINLTQVKYKKPTAAKTTP